MKKEEPTSFEYTENTEKRYKDKKNKKLLCLSCFAAEPLRGEVFCVFERCGPLIFKEE